MLMFVYTTMLNVLDVRFSCLFCGRLLLSFGFEELHTNGAILLQGLIVAKRACKVF